MANESGGGNRLFLGKTAFSASQIDSVYGGAIPLPTSGTVYNWIQIRKGMDGKITLDRDGATIDIGNDVDGLTDVIITDIDKWTLNFENAQIDKNFLWSLGGFDPSIAMDFAPSATVKGLKGSYIGTSMITNGVPGLLYRSKYDPTNTTDVPKVGNGSDPVAFAICKLVLVDRKISLNYDAKGQLLVSCSMRAVSVDGSTNKGVLGANGALTALA